MTDFDPKQMLRRSQHGHLASVFSLPLLPRLGGKRGRPPMKLDDAQAQRQTMACALIALFRTHHAPSMLERTFRNTRSEVAPILEQEMLNELPATKILLDAFEAVLRENKKEKRSHA